jgi:alpha-tubulin suppressor-like RCC1 family protein
MSQVPAISRCLTLVPVRRWIIRASAPALLLAAIGCHDDATAPTAPDATLGVAAASSAALTFIQVSGGHSSAHTCGITSDNLAYCWGWNFSGQLGDGTTQDRSRPVPVAGGLRFRQVSPGSEHTCGVTIDYRAYCWGHGGRLGDGTQEQHLTPVPVSGTRKYVRIDVGAFHACALAYSDRHAYCWGDNFDGELGTGTKGSQILTPVAVAGGRSWREVAPGAGFTCGITTARVAYCWGSDDQGKLGDGDTRQDQLVPTPVAGGRQFDELDAGFDFSCAISTADRAFCWGAGDRGQIGDGSNLDRYTPRAVAGGISFNRVTAGSRFACGETIAHQAYCWGDNGRGQFGNGATQSSTRPKLGAGGREFNQVSSGGEHACGITASDGTYCWGSNEEGQLGNGTSGTDSPAPVRVAAP